jgi:hypothetical protein
VVTVSQLRAERKRGMRGARAALNKFQRPFNQLHRELDKRLEGHRKDLLDLKDAQKILDLWNLCDTQWQEAKGTAAVNLQLFFE